jgi:hypothetical protein
MAGGREDEQHVQRTKLIVESLIRYPVEERFSLRAQRKELESTTNAIEDTSS